MAASFRATTSPLIGISLACVIPDMLAFVAVVVVAAAAASSLQNFDRLNRRPTVESSH